MKLILVIYLMNNYHKIMINPLSQSQSDQLFLDGGLNMFPLHCEEKSKIESEMKFVLILGTKKNFFRRGGINEEED